MISLETLLRKTQEGLFALIFKKFKGNCVSCKNKYIFVPGDAPVLLVAHLDTVHQEPVKVICTSKNRNILMSPQGIGGDDRCGVYALLKIYEKSQVKPNLLFTCDEEIGGFGAEAFTDDYFANITNPGKNNAFDKLKNIKLIIEVDRKGDKDAVYYNCGNKDFENYITSKGFVTAYGSFSDISIIAPAMDTAGVNLSSGYYNAHTLHEYINCAELEQVITKILSIIKDSYKETFQRYKYIEKQYLYPLSGKWKNIFAEDMDIINNSFDDNLPQEMENQYHYLVDIYGKAEIDEYRRYYGDEIVRQLYLEEIESERKFCV